jgi:hypothetical protein
MTEGALAAGGEGVGRGLAAAGRKLMAPSSEAFTQARRDLLERAQEQGFQPNFTQITEPPIAGRMARITERIFDDPSRLANVRTARNKMQEFREAFGSPVDAATTGQVVKSSIRNRVNHFRDTSALKYSSVDEIF